VLTHCNAGALATAGYGTAVGVIQAAWDDGKRFHVFADETRPLLQGARLTAWELVQAGIPVTVLTDNMAGWLMKKEKVSLVVWEQIGSHATETQPTRSDIRPCGSREVASGPFLRGGSDLNARSFTRFGKDIPIEERARTK